MPKKENTIPASRSPFWPPQDRESRPPRLIFCSQLKRFFTLGDSLGIFSEARQLPLLEKRILAAAGSRLTSQFD
ncbi:hypothetical protein PI124_g1707 [Phytophthora idaei]|nr:hypothetical protein PI124_g1707 [Phytophthora idaei]